MLDVPDLANAKPATQEEAEAAVQAAVDDYRRACQADPPSPEDPPHTLAGYARPDLSDYDYRTNKVLACIHPHDRPAVAVLAAQARSDIQAAWTYIDALCMAAEGTLLRRKEGD